MRKKISKISTVEPIASRCLALSKLLISPALLIKDLGIRIPALSIRPEVLLPSSKCSIALWVFKIQKKGMTTDWNPFNRRSHILWRKIKSWKLWTGNFKRRLTVYLRQILTIPNRFLSMNKKYTILKNRSMSWKTTSLILKQVRKKL